MAFANLTAAQFLALAGMGSAFVLLLYLLVGLPLKAMKKEGLPSAKVE